MSRIALLTRTQSGIDGKFGFLEVGRLSFRTGELPWRFNEKNVSCIPAGDYKCAWTYSPQFKRHTYQVLDVPGRNGIRFHAANYFASKNSEFLSQVYGCIGLGHIVGTSMGQKMLLRSKQAMDSFEKYLGGEPFTLRIIGREKLVTKSW